jgi:hypothetical protein
MIKCIFQIILLISISTVSIAQKAIVLSKRNQRTNGSEILISTGDRVKCKFTNGEKVIGEVLSIGGDSVLIDGSAYFIDDIRAIAKRQKGSTMLFIGGQVILPLAVLTAVIVDNIPVAAVFFVTDVATRIALNKLLHDYPLRNVKRKWKLTVIDYPL